MQLPLSYFVTGKFLYLLVVFAATVGSLNALRFVARATNGGKNLNRACCY